MDRSKETVIISHKGHPIIYLDYSNKTEEEILEMMDWSVRNLADWCSEGQKAFLLLVNMLGAYTTPPVIEKVKALARESRPYVKKGAVVTISKPTTRIIFQLVNRIAGDTRKMFTNLEDAKEWLIAP